jgi:hypothetical protein
MAQDVLAAVDSEATEQEPATMEEISLSLNGGVAHYGHDAPIWKALPRLLNELRRAGYIEKARGGYVLTPKGKA